MKQENAMLTAAQCLGVIEDKLAAVFIAHSPQTLYEPMRYALQTAGAKRVRPIMAMLAAQLFTDKITDAHWNAAIAIEVLHNFTLVHDDIMDNAALRRGQPTVTERFGVNTAILSGDALLVYAYRCLCQCSNAIHRLLPVFNEAAAEVCEGQQLDADFERLAEITTERYFEMSGKKTAALLVASCVIGALSANADDNDAHLLRDFGYNLGIAFQLQDDYMDVYGSEDIFGKKIGGDITQCKKTYLFAIACSNLPSGRKEAFLNVFVQQHCDASQKIKMVKEFYNEASVQKHALDAIVSFFEKSMLSLRKVGVADPRKQELEYFAHQLMNRNK